MFELNLCKYIYEEEKKEIIDEIYFEKICVDNNKVVVSNFNRPLAKVVIASSSDLPVQRLS
ncbi:hypothetical protein I5730_17540 [Acinetobacter nosocomialis]|nr:hypothetical protein J582_4020 [Acinetobacter sp. 1566109]MBJ9962322.1 hypothetical protein [Acinetobacter nosocomialis]